MTTWTPEQLDAIDAAHEVQIAPRRRDGSLREPVTIWLVRLGNELFVRSVNGPTAAWYRGTNVQHDGRIQAGNEQHDVQFVDADHGLDDRIDEAYGTKYRSSPNAVGHINSPRARSTTLKLVPRT